VRLVLDQLDQAAEVRTSRAFVAWQAPRVPKGRGLGAAQSVAGLVGETGCPVQPVKVQESVAEWGQVAEEPAVGALLEVAGPLPELLRAPA